MTNQLAKEHAQLYYNICKFESSINTNEEAQAWYEQLSEYEKERAEDKYDPETAKSTSGGGRMSALIVPPEYPGNWASDTALMTRREIYKYFKKNYRLWVRKPVPAIPVVQETSVGRPISVNGDYSGYSRLDGVRGPNAQGTLLVKEMARTHRSMRQTCELFGNMGKHIEMALVVYAPMVSYPLKVANDTSGVKRRLPSEGIQNIVYYESSTGFPKEVTDRPEYTPVQGNARREFFIGKASELFNDMKKQIKSEKSVDVTKVHSVVQIQGSPAPPRKKTKYKNE